MLVEPDAGDGLDLLIGDRYAPRTVIAVLGVLARLALRLLFFLPDLFRADDRATLEPTDAPEPRKRRAVLGERDVELLKAWTLDLPHGPERHLSAHHRGG